MSLYYIKEKLLGLIFHVSGSELVLYFSGAFLSLMQELINVIILFQEYYRLHCLVEGIGNCFFDMTMHHQFNCSDQVKTSPGIQNWYFVGCTEASLFDIFAKGEPSRSSHLLGANYLKSPRLQGEGQVFPAAALRRTCWGPGEHRRLGLEVPSVSWWRDRMESSLSSLTFKGSISEAITEAKDKKKLFLVYISDKDDESSTVFEESMWSDANVVESVSRKCVFLHLLQGTVDASNFSAIYVQKSVPCISAIGYNGGKLLWQLEGQVSAENLVAAIEKSCANLQLQETAAAVLSAALAAKKSESSSDDAHTASCSSVDKAQQGSEAHLSHASESDIETSSEVKQVTSSQSNTTRLQQLHNEELVSTAKPPSVSQDEIDVDKSNIFETSVDGSTEGQEEVTFEDAVASDEVSFESAKKNEKSIPDEVEESAQEQKLKFAEKNEKIIPDEVEESIQDQKLKFTKSNDVHLNIRLPNGSNLQVKFLVTDTLAMVKDYVDENKTSGIWSYDLAVPYPRRVFTAQDMSKNLAELGFVNREALIVVPHRSMSESYRGKQVQYERSNTIDSSGGYGGYFGYAKRILSFFNPFSYVGGGTSPGTESTPNDGLWQYRPNTGVQNSGIDRSSRPDSPDVQASAIGESSSQGRKATTRQFGSNIHTLRHDDDDNRPSDRNAFWNGNSTQYGGDNNN
ncbi:hypothetical protein H6P81_013259 [Aristolochia fimbriata]|uniref:UBX domain-containing protein n=1 Tax=Aristolochia fimbriata TaxID=158543 RepID=A0AAV7EH34_ARIFI|nr:hypothetical protein H6P81_013259 [Aristolochia fimbriata]